MGAHDDEFSIVLHRKPQASRRGVKKLESGRAEARGRGAWRSRLV
jgi:hypothetical protein